MEAQSVRTSGLQGAETSGLRGAETSGLQSEEVSLAQGEEKRRSPGRSLSVDLMKGFGILTVVFSHIFYVPETASGYPVYAIAYAIMAGVLGMFFLLSGYYYTPGRRYAENIKKRFCKLMIPCLLMMAATGIIGYAAEWIFCGSADVLSYLLNYVKRLYEPTAFLPVGTSGWDGSLVYVFYCPCWFFIRLFCCDLIFYALADFCQRKFTNLLLIVVPFLTATALYNRFVSVNFFFQPQTVLACTALMLTAAYARKHDLVCKMETCKKDKKYWCIVVAAFAAFSIVAWLCWNYQGPLLCFGIYDIFKPTGFESVFIWYICAIIASFAGLIVCSWIAKIPVIIKPVLYCGKTSAFILCFHIVFAWIIVQLFDKANSLSIYLSFGDETPFTTPYFVQTIALFGSLIVCCLLSYLKSRIRIRAR